LRVVNTVQAGLNVVFPVNQAFTKKWPPGTTGRPDFFQPSIAEYCESLRILLLVC